MKNVIKLNNPVECQPCPVCGITPEGMDEPCLEKLCPNKIIYESNTIQTKRRVCSL
jgi:hypothetical protein